MSHFKVAVFHGEGQSIEELLAPYDEEINTLCENKLSLHGRKNL